MGPFLTILIVLAVVVLALIIGNIKIVPQAQAVVVERLGAYHATWDTGLHVKMPLIDGSPGAPQLSTTFHHVMPFIFSTANQAR